MSETLGSKRLVRKMSRNVSIRSITNVESSPTMNDDSGVVEKNRRNSGRVFLERIIAPSHENFHMLATRATSDLKGKRTIEQKTRVRGNTVQVLNLRDSSRIGASSLAQIRLERVLWVHVC